MVGQQPRTPHWLRAARQFGYFPGCGLCEYAGSGLEKSGCPVSGWRFCGGWSFRRLSRMNMTKAELVLDARNATGESPVWQSQEQALYWVDTVSYTHLRAHE